MKALRTIRGRMMLCYVSIITATVFVMSFFYYRSTAASLESRAAETLQQLSINSTGNVDSVIYTMDSTANRIISSDLIKNAFYQQAETPAQQMQKRRELIDLLFTVNGSKIDTQINLIATDGTFAEFGRAFDLTAAAARPQQACTWFDGALAQEGRIFLVAPRVYEWDDSERVVFSVCRSFNRAFGAPYDALVEVLLDYDVLARTVESAVRPKGVAAYVYDSAGNLLYPAQGSAPVIDYLSLIPDSAQSGTFPVKAADGKQIAAYHRSQASGITMVVCENEAAMLLPVRTFRNRLILLGSGLLLLTTAVTFVLANQLTRPLRRIRQSISGLQLTDLHAEAESAPLKSTYELESLGRAYTQMVARLEHSLAEAVTAHSHEVEARMQALQSQMNPHFLYNTITVISIKAEDNDDLEVVGMCECLSGMLRYVTRESGSTVPLQQELDYLEQYLYLMRCRYPDRFHAHISVPQELRALLVPKLVVQPLVENSFKHGFQNSGNWELQLTGEQIPHGWQICVQDNGVGFTEEALARLHEQFKAAQGDFRPDGGDHIGLANIFERLRFHYKQDAIFCIENMPSGGCRVTIGGINAAIQQEAKPHA